MMYELSFCSVFFQVFCNVQRNYRRGDRKTFGIHLLITYGSATGTSGTPRKTTERNRRNSPRLSLIVQRFRLRSRRPSDPRVRTYERAFKTKGRNRLEPTERVLRRVRTTGNDRLRAINTRRGRSPVVFFVERAAGAVSPAAGSSINSKTVAIYGTRECDDA